MAKQTLTPLDSSATTVTMRSGGPGGNQVRAPQVFKAKGTKEAAKDLVESVLDVTEAEQAAWAQGVETSEELPQLLAQATTGVVAPAPAAVVSTEAAGTASAPGANAGAAAVAAGATSSAAALLVLGGVGLAALAGAGASGDKSVSQLPVDSAAPAAPVITAVATNDVVNLAEKTAGVSVSGTAEAGASVAVTWGSTTKTVTATGGVWSASFSSAEVPADTSTTISAVATDAAGNASAAGTRTVVLDIVAPVISVSGVHSGADGAATIVLTADGSLDASHLPAPSDFNITTGGVPNTVSNVSVIGNTLTLTLATGFAQGAAVTFAYVDAAGDTVNAIQDAAGNDVASLSASSALVADGYVRGAQIWLETMVDGSPVRTNTGVVTDESGNFFLPAGVVGTIVAVGGVNIDTGVPNTMELKAPEGATTINPLTTLVQELVQASGGVTSPADAATAVANALGLTLPAGQDLLGFDPISSGDVTAQKAAAQVATIVTLAESAGSGAGVAVIAGLAEQMSTVGVTVDLADSTTLSAIVETALAAPSVIIDGAADLLAIQSAISDAATAIEAATSLTDISSAQSQALDKLAASAPTVSAPSATNDITPTVRVSFNVTATDGTAAVVGDTVVLQDGGVQLATAVLTADDIAAGFKNVDASVLTEGEHSLTATLTDQAGNTSSASTAASVIIDIQAPSSPTILGVASDDLIGVGEQAASISGQAEANASVQVTVGGNVRTVTADSNGAWAYTLTDADITAMGQGAETLSATATDAAGNTSAAGTRNISVDTVASTATVVITGVADNVDPAIGNVTNGGASNDNTLDLAGTVSAALTTDEVLAVYDGAVRLGDATVTGTTWVFNSAGLSNAAHNFTSRVEDAAGNAGLASAAYLVTVNATVPIATVSITGAADDIGIASNVISGGVTNDTSPLLSGAVSGTLAVDDTVVLYDGASRLGQASVSGNTWTYAVTGLGAGSHAFTAVVEGAGGNQGSASSSYILAVDATGPAAPTINPVAVDNVVNSAEKTAGVSVSGTAEAGSSVAVTWGSTTKTVTATGGVWSASFSSAEVPADASINISAIANDAAGNASTAGVRAVLVDALAPSVSINTVAADNAVNSAELAGGVAITGTAEANARVALTMGSNTRSVIANGTGDWTYTLTQADVTAMGQGAETLSAIATDTAGNASVAASKNITVDSASPLLTAFALVAASDSGVKGDGKSNVLAPSIQFTAEAGATLEIDVGGGSYVSAGAGTGSVQTLTAPAYTADGSYSVKLRATDAAGNTTVRTGSYQLDSAAPAAPVISAVATDDVVNLAEKTAGVSVSGTAEAGASVAVTWGSTTKTVTAMGGAWSTSFSGAEVPADASTTISAIATDAAGNASSVGTRTVVLDSAAPAAPVISAVATDDVVNLAEKTAGVSVSGTAEAGASVAVIWGSTTKTVTATGGTWSASFSSAEVPADASTTISAVATDAAGNGSPGGSRTVVVDTLAPLATASITDAEDNVPSSSITHVASGATTNDNTPRLVGTLTGVLASGEVLAVYEGATRLGEAVVNGNAWSFAASSLSNGSHSFSVQLEDAAGNQGVAGSDYTFTVDATVPAATATITSVAANTNDQTPSLSGAIVGTFAATDIVRIFDGVTYLGDGVVSGTSWTYTPTTALAQGAHQFTAVVENLGGNQGTVSPVYDMVIDVTSPNMPEITVVAIDDVVNLAEKTAGVSVSGTAEAGASVAVTWGGTTKTVTAAGGAWSTSFSGAEVPADASTTISAIATDAAGNASAAATHDVLVDTSTPTLQGVVLNGNSLTLTYDQALDAVHAPEKTAFEVTVNDLAVVLNAPSVSGNVVTLTLASPIPINAAVKLSYTDPSASDDVAALQDAAGNDVQGIVPVALNVSTTTKIDWISELNPGVKQSWDKIYVQVHFNHPVVIDSLGGVPQLELQFVDDSGHSHTVMAHFQQYAGFSGVTQNSAQFVYQLTDADLGSYHIGNVNLNGGSIVAAAAWGGGAVNLALDSTNQTIMAASYVFLQTASGGVNITAVGTAANDQMGIYEINPALTPTNGVYAVDGGAGNRDILGVPVVLPQSLNIDYATASTYSLRYDALNHLMNVVTPDGVTVLSVTVPDAAHYPPGIESLVYHIVYDGGTNGYQGIDAKNVTLSGSVIEYTDPVVATDIFVQGSQESDTINKSGDTSTTTRYVIRGSAGNDTITGHGGVDVIFGDGGANTIDAGAGNDLIFVGNGADTIDGGAGSDKLVITLAGQESNIGPKAYGALIQSQVGNWTSTGFVATATTDAYQIRVGDNGIKVTDAVTNRNTTATNIEALQIRYEQNDSRDDIPVLFGTAGNDTLSGSATGGILAGGAGNDTLNAGDVGGGLFGGSGDDTLNGGLDSDALFGDAGVDILNGGAGDDVLVGGAGDDTLNGDAGLDTAIFVTAGTGNGTGVAVGSVANTAISYAYDAANNRIMVKQGATDLAAITEGVNGGWSVQDLTATAGAYTAFGTDTLSGVDKLSFTWTGNTAAQVITSSSLLALLPSANTKIDWVSDQSGGGPKVAGDTLYFQVHFTQPVVVGTTSGTPQLDVQIFDDAGVAHTVQATFQPYSGMVAGSAQTSMQFVYQLQAADVGQYHVGALSLNGGSVTEVTWIDGQMVAGKAANLALDSTNTAFTAGGYLYGDAFTTGATGTAKNDLIGIYEQNPASTPTNGVFTGIDGGAGNRDILGVPVVLAGVSDLVTANSYTLKYTAGTPATPNTPAVPPTVTAVAQDGTTVATMTVPLPAGYPTGVETLVYHIVYNDSVNGYQSADVKPVILSAAVATYTDPVVTTDLFVQGSQANDTIDKSGDTSTATRYVIRGSAGNDTITGHAGTDVIFGDGGANTINAGAGNDLIFVGNGADTIDGGAGNDKLVITLAGQQSNIGPKAYGALIQSQTGSWDSTGFHATTTTDAYQIRVGDTGIKVTDVATNRNTTATNIEAIQIRYEQNDSRDDITVQFGTSGDDVLTDSATGGIVAGGAGNDTLNASAVGGGLFGGSGDDTLNGGTDSDALFGDAGADILNGGAGDDILVGGADNDTLEGGAGVDTAIFVVAGAGNGTGVAVGSIANTAISYAYDAATSRILVKQGATDLAAITEVVGGSWAVEDLTASTANVYTAFGTDTLSGVDKLSFTWTGKTAGNLVNLLNGTAADDVLEAHDTQVTLAAGGEGNDTFNLSKANGTLFEGGGIFDGGAGTDTVTMEVDPNLIPTGYTFDIVSTGADSWQVREVNIDPQLAPVGKFSIVRHTEPGVPAFDLVFYQPNAAPALTETVVNMEFLALTVGGNSVAQIGLGTTPVLTML
ncbi:MAG: hypothetical protein RJA34_1712 [Pseudomonadota bacterium]